MKVKRAMTAVKITVVCAVTAVTLAAIVAVSVALAVPQESTPGTWDRDFTCSTAYQADLHHRKIVAYLAVLHENLH